MIASDGASGRALTEHGPCLIGGTVTLDDVSFITEIAIHIAEKTPLRLTDAELSMCRGATGGMTGKTRRRVCSGEQRLLRVIRRCRPSATCPATNRRGSWRLIAVMVAVGGGRAPPPLRCYPRGNGGFGLGEQQKKCTKKKASNRFEENCCKSNTKPRRRHFLFCLGGDTECLPIERALGECSLS